jgi:hypothetical protein
MTLDDLYTELLPTFPPSVQKDLKTAVRVLSQTLDHPDPRHCPLEACRHPLTYLFQLVEAHLTRQGKGPFTIRNTKNNISRLFRAAEAKALFIPAPVALTSRFNPKARPPRPGSEHSAHNGTYLRFHHWPQPLQTEFQAFHTWATASLIPGRPSRWRKRLPTLQRYREAFESYFGYLHHIQHLHPLIFNYLFEYSLIEAYLYWHINEQHHRMTWTGYAFLGHVLALTRQYRPLPELRAKLQALRRTLPHPTPVYQKGDAWLPLAELERVGLALWPHKHPSTLHSNRRLTAFYAGMSLMFRLWVYIPYRQRNMREMRLRDNLYRDAHGHWRIRFSGEQLKIATRKGQTNVLDLPFPEPLAPILDGYLTTWRPLLTGSTPSPYVFLTRDGRPFTGPSLTERAGQLVYRYTGQHWHPHMIRTVWTTEWIRTTGDFYTAAVMLNDKLETVIQSYAHLRDENVADKAYQWVRSHMTL